MSLHESIFKSFSIIAVAALTLTAGSPSTNPGAGTTGAGTTGAGTTPLRATSPAIADPAGKAKVEAPVPSANGPCAAGMILVEGDYCPDAEQTCLRWLDPPPYQNLRCGEYAKPAKCKGSRQHKKFCIDREEYTEPSESGAPDALPVVKKNWGEAKAICEARGARLCREAEWEFACEGPDMNPYPYGFERKAGYCNIDRTDLGGTNDKLTDHRAPLSAFPQCTSPFGVHHMTGNVDEWVEREGIQAPYRSALRGGWWLPGRNRCRAATREHDEAYQGKQVGFRCCADTK